MKTTMGIFVATIFIRSIGHTQGTLDQFYDPAGANVFAVNFGGASPGQTFTVGLAGYITRVDVFIGRNESQTAGDISWSLRSTVGGVPVAGLAGVLASGTFPYGSLLVSYTYQPCLISSLVPVTAGQVLGITLSSDHMFTWAGHDANPYTRGSQQVAGGSQGPWTPNAGVDLGFKTFGQPVPEPSGMAMFGVACSVLLLGLRCRSRRSNNCTIR